ncbi:MAG: cytochrome P450, partial [Actinomycetota bacterium]|nr:cytochrome P450 [Actinomycetota bacterium]
AGEKVVMWYVSSGRDETRYEDPNRFEVTRNPEHQAFGAGGRHFCLGTALARLELRIMLEKTLARYPQMARDGQVTYVESGFLNQLKSLPVRLRPRAAEHDRLRGQRPGRPASASRPTARSAQSPGRRP